MIKTIIVDDEPAARETIALVIENQFKSLKIEAQTGSVKESVEAINRIKPEILFLDVDLPDGTGFDILKAVDYKEIKVIFTTAYQEYAIQAIKFSAFDYILKPAKPGEIVSVINRVIAETIEPDNQKKIEAVLSGFQKGGVPQKIVLKTLERIYVVNLDEIIRCESENNYTVFFLTDGNKIMVSKSLKTYEEMLGSAGFKRVHQSHLINPSFIRHFEKQEGGYLVMSDNSKVPVSAQQKQNLLNYFDSL